MLRMNGTVGAIASDYAALNVPNGLGRVLAMFCLAPCKSSALLLARIRPRGAVPVHAVAPVLCLHPLRRDR